MVLSHRKNFSLFGVSVAGVSCHFCARSGPRPHDQLEADDTDVEKILLSCDITEIWMKWVVHVVQTDWKKSTQIDALLRSLHFQRCNFLPAAGNFHVVQAAEVGGALGRGQAAYLGALEGGVPSWEGDDPLEAGILETGVASVGT